MPCPYGVAYCVSWEAKGDTQVKFGGKPLCPGCLKLAHLYKNASLFLRRPDGLYTDPQLRHWLVQLSDNHCGQRGWRIVFIPWNHVEGQEWVDKTNQWNLRKNNRFQIVTYDPAIKHHDAFEIANSLPWSVIYIRGHGNPGQPYIQVKMSVPGKTALQTKKLPIEDACQRLIDMGLSPAYPGAIKFYSCHSGTKLIPEKLQDALDQLKSQRDFIEQHHASGVLKDDAYAFWMENNKWPTKDESMAKQGANYFRSKGFNKCIFFGYLGPLGAVYEDPDDTGEWHKVVKLDGLHDAPAGLEGKSQVRPSVARIRV
jgi:hypothetical protein